MKSFKFFQSNNTVSEFNLYEEMVIGLFMYCRTNAIVYDGYSHSFNIQNRRETITILNVRYESVDRMLYFDYDITSEGQTYRHVFTIEEERFERLTSYERV